MPRRPRFSELVRHCLPAIRLGYKQNARVSSCANTTVNSSQRVDRSQGEDAEGPKACKGPASKNASRTATSTTATPAATEIQTKDYAGFRCGDGAISAARARSYGPPLSWSLGPALVFTVMHSSSSCSFYYRALAVALLAALCSLTWYELRSLFKTRQSVDANSKTPPWRTNTYKPPSSSD